MSLYALSAIGRDRPGIVAAISRVLLDLEGNVEDSQMSILRGHFAVMLIVALPEGASAEELERRLAEVKDELSLEAIVVSPVDELAESGPRATHVLSVYGADHPGIVHAVSAALAERGVSITGLETRLGGAEGSPIYVMLMEIAAGEADAGELAASLREIGEREGLDVSLRELTADAL
ncbi:MAG: glycine cleavage system protein R [Solirubrobacterales bacterium]